MDQVPPSPPPRHPPLLLPRPRSVRWGPGPVLVPHTLVLALIGRQRELLPAARRFQQLAAGGLGIAVELAASAAGLETETHVRVDAGDPAVTHPEGYSLTIKPGGGGPDVIHIRAGTAAGAAYGLATLRQILAGTGRQLPAAEIHDYPDFPRRGVMLDISRGKVPTMDSLYRLVDLLADLKVNEFQLYTEHTFAYRRHREVWQNYSPMTGEEILALDRYCRERFIDLVPNQNSFGHLTPWLVHPRYQHLAETLDGFDLPWGGRHEEPFSLCPLEPAVIPFLAGLYDELLPHFTSRYFNVGCDETFDLGQGRSRQAVAAEGQHRVYLRHLLRIHELVQARGRTMQFWGDIIVQAPELIPELPREAVALEWGYEADHPFADHCAHFAGSGIPFYVCPGTSTWNSLAGRTDNGLANMRSAADNGLRYGAAGFLNTIWGDRGHQDYQPVWYPGIAYGAAVSWAPAANRDADVRPFLNRLVFADAAARIGGVLHDLGNVYQAVGHTPHNASILGILIHRGFDPHGALDPVTAADYDRAAGAIGDAAAGLAGLSLGCDDAALVLRELHNTVRMLLHACALGRTRLDVQAGRRPAGERVRALARDLDEIMAEHRQLWLARNRIGGLEEMSLAPLRRIRRQYAELLQPPPKG